MPKTKEQMCEYMKARYKQRRELAYAKLGGVCAKCGSIERLEIDHVDRTKKEMSFTGMFCVGLPRFYKELEKCQLLCYQCHRAKTLVDLGFKAGAGAHGGITCAVRHCKPICDLCRATRNKYNRERKRRVRLAAKNSGGEPAGTAAHR